MAILVWIRNQELDGRNVKKKSKLKKKNVDEIRKPYKTVINKIQLHRISNFFSFDIH